jgi:Flp pilus assembly protein TadG
MRKPFTSRGVERSRGGERGVTMVLVAMAMVTIIAMAALSIDVVTLYVSREEAQRAADAAALAAARVVSVSGITGAADPDTEKPYWQAICGGSAGTANLAAIAAAQANGVGGSAPTVSNITYSAQGATGGFNDCSSLGPAFAVNPTVTVQVKSATLPTLFSRIWSRSARTVSATAMAEAFNPSDSGIYVSGGEVVPARPRCVKPWITPNYDPFNPSGCTTNCQPFVDQSDGHIINPGISLNGLNTNGAIGERFVLIPDCQHRTTGYCAPRTVGMANLSTNGSYIPGTPPQNLEYLPGQTLYASVAVPSAAAGSSFYEQAIAGCDQTTVYQCGVPYSSASPQNMVDLSENPASTNDTTNGVMALTNENNPNPNGGQPDGQDTFYPTYAAPAAYPFEIVAGSRNPYVAANTPVSGSTSIVTVPLYDPSNTIASTGTSPVTIVGFLQVFINAVDQYGNVDLTVLNIAGCGTAASTTLSAPGTSPLPIRLITPQ